MPLRCRLLAHHYTPIPRPSFVTGSPVVARCKRRGCDAELTSTEAFYDRPDLLLRSLGQLDQE